MGVVAPSQFLVLVLCSAMAFLGAQGAYTPKDNYLIACGSTTATASDSYGRKWVGDASPAASSYLAGNPTSVEASTSSQDPNLPSTVPYLGARIITSPVSYSFPIIAGRHWLRLYFYPFSYENYDPSLAIVSVKVNSYSLITNMSIVREVEALNYDYIEKEYSLNVTSSPLVVSFIPGTVKGAYAMVNGIELISMPDDIFSSSIYFAEFATQLPLAMGGTVVETLYRLNVGGQSISPENDELSRSWGTDIGYIPTAATGVQESTQHSIAYTQGLDQYVAPLSVYQTARTMTNFDYVNINSNLTWSFSVDPGFYYYIRLHFCEFDYSLINERVFDIYINSEVAQASFDVVAKAEMLDSGSSKPANTTGEYQALVMDYGATISPNASWSASRMAVTLHPTNATAPLKFNAILNGLEIFKLNDSTGNLQGPPPPLLAVPTGVAAEKASSRGSSKLRIVIGAAVAVVVIALLIAGSLLCRRTRNKGDGSSSPAWLPLPLYGSISRSLMSKSSSASPKSAAGSYASSAASNLCRHFTFEEIASMTNNFDEARILGVGGFGKVYEGELEDGTKVAVKRGNASSEQGVMEFQTEIELLSKLRHRHLVSLIGYCEEHNEMILVYDCMANGPLRGHLYGTDLPKLSWKQRLDICVGAARGLHYLHTGSARGIIHRDVKTTNILLDEKLVAKVSDFGLSKTGPTLDHTHVSTAVKGSFGYLDPEYFRRQQLTEKSDVYSFGVVLMEVLCARPVINPTLPREEINLAEWAMKWQKKGMLDQIIDPYLVGKISRESMRKFAETAERCLQDHGSDRPNMGDVLWNLEYALQLHESSVEKALDESNPRVVDLPIRVLETSELEDDNSEVKGKNGMESNSGTKTQNLLSEDSDDVSISAVFSQLVNPQGR